MFRRSTKFIHTLEILIDNEYETSKENKGTIYLLIKEQYLVYNKLLESWLEQCIATIEY